MRSLRKRIDAWRQSELESMSNYVSKDPLWICTNPGAPLMKEQVKEIAEQIGLAELFPDIAKKFGVTVKGKEE